MNELKDLNKMLSFILLIEILFFIFGILGVSLKNDAMVGCGWGGIICSVIIYYRVVWVLCKLKTEM